MFCESAVVFLWFFNGRHGNARSANISRNLIARNENVRE